MDADNSASESAKSPEPQGIGDVDSGDARALRDVKAKLEPGTVSSRTRDFDPFG
jgi:hypothetical protein